MRSFYHQFACTLAFATVLGLHRDCRTLALHRHIQRSPSLWLSHFRPAAQVMSWRVL